MKFVDEYRNAEDVKRVIDRILSTTSHKWRIMEICGGQTHAFFRYGIDELLREKITLLHGPGCPVCVTPLEQIDKAIALASKPDVIFCSFGDMVRVPGSQEDLLSVKARGGDVRIVYSPMDALKIAEQSPNSKVVFFAIGFETTAPMHAMVVAKAFQQQQHNFSILSSLVLVPPAICALLSSPENKIEGFIAAGHVCSVMGYHEYPSIAKQFGVPIVVTGFEPLDLVLGIQVCVQQLEINQSKVENAYKRSVTKQGNIPAQNTIKKIFRVADRQWRGIGTIPKSGLVLREKYAKFDAEKIFDLGDISVSEPEECISGLILQGLKKPPNCPEFGNACTPEHPMGATMVSSEGACAAYFRYKK
jgi:hydrogenase expression/formation protein HypD